MTAESFVEVCFGVAVLAIAVVILACAYRMFKDKR